MDGRDRRYREVDGGAEVCTLISRGRPEVTPVPIGGGEVVDEEEVLVEGVEKELLGVLRPLGEDERGWGCTR